MGNNATCCGGNRTKPSKNNIYYGDEEEDEDDETLDIRKIKMNEKQKQSDSSSRESLPTKKNASTLTAKDIKIDSNPSSSKAEHRESEAYASKRKEGKNSKSLKSTPTKLNKLNSRQVENTSPATIKKFTKFMEDYKKYLIHQNNEVILGYFELNERNRKSKSPIAITTEALYFLDDNLDKVTKRIPVYNFKKLYRKKHGEELILIGYNQKYHEDFVTKDEKEFKVHYEIKGDKKGEEIEQVLSQAFSNKFSSNTKLKIIQVKNDVDLLFDFEASNQKHLNNYINIKNFIGRNSENDHSIYGIYKVQRPTKADKPCLRVLTITSKSIITLFGNKLEFKDRFNLSELITIKISESNDQIMLVFKNNNPVFISKSSEEIALIIKRTYEKAFPGKSMQTLYSPLENMKEIKKPENEPKRSTTRVSNDLKPLELTKKSISTSPQQISFKVQEIPKNLPSDYSDDDQERPEVANPIKGEDLSTDELLKLACIKLAEHKGKLSTKK